MTKKTQPFISVVMPVYNAGDFLAPAINSILHQTYRNFELILVDDASTDNSLKIIKSFSRKDKRIRVLKNRQNLGVSATSNFAISQARYPLIARIDSDDVALPQRLEFQVKYLLKHPKTVAVGTQCLIINESNQIIGHKTFPLNNKELREMIFWAVPMQQPSMMVNTANLPQDFQWYNPKCASAEEIDVIFRFMQYGPVANIPQYGLLYRYRQNSLSHINPKSTFWMTLKSRFQAWQSGFQPSFKAIILNLAQTATISILPNSAINSLWNLIRDNGKTATLDYLIQNVKLVDEEILA